MAAVLSWYDPVVGQVRETHLDRIGLFRWIDRYLGSVDEETNNGKLNPDQQVETLGKLTWLNIFHFDF